MAVIKELFSNVVYNGLGTPIAGFLTASETIDYVERRNHQDGHNEAYCMIWGNIVFKVTKELSIRTQYNNYMAQWDDIGYGRV
jgi:hypothetical protein